VQVATTRSDANTPPTSTHASIDRTVMNQVQTNNSRDKGDWETGHIINIYENAVRFELQSDDLCVRELTDLNVTWCDLAPRTGTCTQTSIAPPWDSATDLSVEGRIRRSGIDLLQKIGIRVGLELDVCVRRAHTDTGTSWTQT
jgi:hypothetical protein